MTPVQTKSEKISSIASSCMLVHFTVSKYRATKSDKESALELAQQKQADVSMVSVTKKLLESGHMVEIDKPERTLKKWLKTHSLPWHQDAVFLLPNSFHMDFVKEFNEAKSIWEPAVNEFVAKFPSLVKEAKAKGNYFLKDEYYPSQRELKSKFSFEYYLGVVPEGQTLAAVDDLSETERKKIQKDMDTKTSIVAKNAVDDLLIRFIKPISHMSQKLKEYKQDPNFEGATKFHESLVSNIEEILDVVPILNVTKNREIEKIAYQIAKNLTHYDTDTLRNDDQVRQQVQKSADEILQKISDYFGG